MIVSVTPSRHEFLLALWNFLCICCWRLISVLLRTFFFEFFFFFFFDRTLVPANALGHFLRSNPKWKRLMCHDDWCATQTDSHNACDISSAPLSSDGLERRTSGKAPRPRGWIYSQTRSTVSGRPTPLDQQRPPLTLRDHVQPSSALSALKKSLVANLSAKRKLSVAKLSAKRNVSLAKRDFLVANGRMAADFSSPENAANRRHWVLAGRKWKHGVSAETKNSLVPQFEPEASVMICSLVCCS